MVRSKSDFLKYDADNSHKNSTVFVDATTTKSYSLVENNQTGALCPVKLYYSLSHDMFHRLHKQKWYKMIQEVFISTVFR